MIRTAAAAAAGALALAVVLLAPPLPTAHAEDLGPVVTAPSAPADFATLQQPSFYAASAVAADDGTATSTVVGLGGLIVAGLVALVYAAAAGLKGGLRALAGALEPFATRYVDVEIYKEAGRTLESALDKAADALAAKIRRETPDIRVDARHPWIAEQARMLVRQVGESMRVRKVAEEELPALILRRIEARL